MRLTGVSFRDAIDMACNQPRRLLGLPPHALEPGQPAQLALFDDASDGLPRLVRFVG
jgi:dihydroorotase-like cyclic amidohydrolase